MTKRERRQEQLNRHYAALVRLAEACGVKGMEGKKLSVKLLKIEQEAHKNAENYCNGVIGEDTYENVQDNVTIEVSLVFGGRLPKGFFVNGDPRGCALKLDSEKAKELIESTGLQRDWGGYGLLAPMITGD